jgi:2-iminobutanoate/2-iminopropanoate deaminase
MLKMINPSDMKPPVSQYSNGVEVAAGARWLHMSGQTASAADGTIPEDFGEQVKEALESVAAILRGAGMTKKDLVKLTVYATLDTRESLIAYRDLRDEWLEGNRPASTYVVVKALASPKLFVEIEGIAAAA